jgi:serine/threonine-protein kinase HipA
MSLAVHVLGRQVATLEAVGDFRSVLAYRDGVAMDDFVSLTMHVRGAPWV